MQRDEKAGSVDEGGKQIMSKWDVSHYVAIYGNEEADIEKEKACDISSQAKKRREGVKFCYTLKK